MVRIFAILFGIAFIAGGIGGYLPAFTQHGLLLGTFEVDSLHNIFHIVTGVIAIMCATSHRMSKVFFAIFGLIYTILAVVGFWRNGDLMLMHVNLADNILHICIGVIALYLGFSRRAATST